MGIRGACDARIPRHDIELPRQFRILFPDISFVFVAETKGKQIGSRVDARLSDLSVMYVLFCAMDSEVITILI